MKNTSESPEGNEQAKTTTARSGTRTSARSKSDSATPGSQEQETRPATRRRTAATSDSSPAASGENKPSSLRARNGTENAQGEDKSSPPRPTRSIAGAGLAPAPSGTTAVNRAGTSQHPYKLHSVQHLLHAAVEPVHQHNSPGRARTSQRRYDQRNVVVERLPLRRDIPLDHHRSKARVSRRAR